MFNPERTKNKETLIIDYGIFDHMLAIRESIHTKK